jgi:hypothetical protein
VSDDVMNNLAETPNTVNIPIIFTNHARKRITDSLTTVEEVTNYLRAKLLFDERVGKTLKFFDGFRRIVVRRDKDEWVVITVHSFSPRKSGRI